MRSGSARTSLRTNALPLVVSATSLFLCHPPESCIILTFAADICSVPSPRSLDLVGQHGPWYGFPESVFPLSFKPGEAAQFRLTSLPIHGAHPSLASTYKSFRRQCKKPYYWRASTCLPSSLLSCPPISPIPLVPPTQPCFGSHSHPRHVSQRNSPLPVFPVPLYLTSQGSLTTSLYLVTTSNQRSYFSTAVMLQFGVLISFNTCPINHLNNQIKTIIIMS